MGEAGEENGPEAAGGSGNALATGGDSGERSGAGRSCLVPRGACARMNGGCPVGSGKQMARSGTAATGAAYSTSPNWAKPLADGGGGTSRGVRTGVSPTRSLLGLGPDSGQGETLGGEGWSGAGSGSPLGSWSGQTVAGAGGEGVKGTGVALGERPVADRGHSFARVSGSSGSCGPHCLVCGYLCSRKDECPEVHDGDTAGCGDSRNGARLPEIGRAHV